jgi:hypothetical protein
VELNPKPQELRATVGWDPLPVYLGVRALAPARTVLLYSDAEPDEFTGEPGTKRIAQEVAGALRDDGFDDVSIVAIGSAYDLSNADHEALKRDAVAHVLYTGGTKGMAARLTEVALDDPARRWYVLDRRPLVVRNDAGGTVELPSSSLSIERVLALHGASPGNLAAAPADLPPFPELGTSDDWRRWAASVARALPETTDVRFGAGQQQPGRRAREPELRRLGRRMPFHLALGVVGHRLFVLDAVRSSTSDKIKPKLFAAAAYARMLGGSQALAGVLCRAPDHEVTRLEQKVALLLERDEPLPRVKVFGETDRRRWADGDASSLRAWLTR